MRIISPFKDYYDSVQGWSDRDDGLVYVRKTFENRSTPGRGIELPLHEPDEARYRALFKMMYSHTGQGNRGSSVWQYAKHFSKRFGRKNLYEDSGVGIVRAWVGNFLYTGVSLEVPDSDDTYAYSVKNITHYFWNFASLQKFLGSDDDKDKEFEKAIGLLYRRHKGLDHVKASFACMAIENSMKEEMIRTRAPIVVADGFNLFIAPKLEKYGFGSVLDSHQMGQNLLMWFGNIASKDDTPIKISDKDRVAQHGFDKWSFRKQPKDMV